MAPKVHHHRQREPSRRVSPDRGGYFYPGEAARILGLNGIDYHQLRRLLLVVSRDQPSTKQSRKWARFTFKDLVMVRTAIDLAGGIGGLRRDRHLRLKRVQEAVVALRRRLRVDDPIATVRLVLRDGQILAQLDGVTFESVSGQQLLDIRKGIDREVLAPTTDLLKRLSMEASEIRGDSENGGERDDLCA